MPEQAIQAWHGLSPLSFGMMSRLAASQNLRDFFRQHNDGEWLHGLCSLLSEWHEAVGFIPYMLDLQEENTALVLSPSTRQGVEVKLRQIDSNNLFFTLLQFALYHQNLLKSLGAAEFNYQPLIEKLALHEPIPPEEYPEHIYEQGCLGYYNWRALRPDGHFDEMQAALQSGLPEVWLWPLIGLTGLFGLAALLRNRPVWLLPLFLLLGLVWSGLAQERLNSFAVPPGEALFVQGCVVEVLSHEQNVFA
ncbi:MAG: hypothetical protein OSJ64_08735, partial [Firmicutes bacterium]|nr:hypothetical protein [Bacillota bacterium]